MGCAWSVCAWKCYDHDAKSSSIWREVITHAIGTPFLQSLNTSNVNRRNFTLLVPNVASIEIVSLWRASTCMMHHNCHGVWNPKVKGKSTLIFLSCEKKWPFHFPMSTFWHSMHHYLHDAKCPFLPYIHRIKCLVNQRNHLLSWTHHVAFAPKTFICVVHKVGAMCDPFPSMKQPKLLTFCLFMEHIIGIF